MAEGKRNAVTLLFWMKVITVSGILAGLFDAAYFFGKAFVQGQSLVRPLHNIAAFWLGNASFSSGASSAALGFVMHFGLSIVVAGFYAVIALTSSYIRKRPIIFGPIYGVIWYFVMHYIVMAWRWPTLFPQFNGWGAILNVFIHITFGLIIAVVFRAYDRKAQQKIAFNQRTGNRHAAWSSRTAKIQ